MSMRRALSDLTSVLRRRCLGKSGPWLKCRFGGSAEMDGLGLSNDAKRIFQENSLNLIAEISVPQTETGVLVE
jgi:hypothetical protein